MNFMSLSHFSFVIPLSDSEKFDHSDVEARELDQFSLIPYRSSAGGCPLGLSILGVTITVFDNNPQTLRRYKKFWTPFYYFYYLGPLALTSIHYVSFHLNRVYF